MFLSTTTDFEVAENFATDTIFYCWLPIKKSQVSNTKIVVKDISSKIKKYDIVINGEVYPEEHEVSLLYGMLPHFLIGILNTKNNEFWPNPAIQRIEKGTEGMVNEKRYPVWSHGLYIDQANFIDQIKRTKLNQYAELINGSIFPNLHTVFEKQSAEVAENE